MDASSPPQLVVVRGRERAAPLPSLSAARVVAFPTLLALVFAGVVLGGHPAAAACLGALVLGALALLGRRATRYGRLVMAAPSTIVALGAALGGWVLGAPSVVLCACLAGVVALLAFASSSAPRGSRLRTKPTELFARALTAEPTTLSLDDGGARVDDGVRRRYFPLAELEAPELHVDAEGVEVLGLADRFDELRLEIVLESPLARDSAARLVERFAELRREETERVARPIPEGFPRRMRTLEAWRADLDALAHGRDGYRGGALDLPALTELFESARAPVDARAAAAYLLATESPGLLEGRLSACTPPLVLALLSPIPAVRGFLSDEDWREALSYLPELVEIAPPTRATRVRVEPALEEGEEAGRAAEAKRQNLL